MTKLPVSSQFQEAEENPMQTIGLLNASTLIPADYIQEEMKTKYDGMSAKQKLLNIIDDALDILDDDSHVLSKVFGTPKQTEKVGRTA